MVPSPCTAIYAALFAFQAVRLSMCAGLSCWALSLVQERGRSRLTRDARPHRKWRAD